MELGPMPSPIEVLEFLRDLSPRLRTQETTDQDAENLERTIAIMDLANEAAMRDLGISPN